MPDKYLETGLARRQQAQHRCVYICTGNSPDDAASDGA
jgi:hypothetical protein